jgi:uncharacterized delta-60 repeat protein
MHRPRSVGAALACLLVVAPLAPAGAVSGDLDPGFGAAGKVVTPFAGGAYAKDVAMTSDQRIVVVGAAAGSSGDGEMAVARYLSDGALDPTFDADGVLTFPVGPDGVDEARAVVVQPNDRIVVSGSDGRDAFVVARLTTDGSLDPSFGSSGIVRSDLSRGDDVAHDVARQPDGRIVVVGQTRRTPRFTVVRYRRNCVLDSTFSGDGVARLGVEWAFATAVVVQPDGRIVVAGFQPGGLVLARFRRDGRLDPTFSGDGVSNAKVWGQWPGDIALQPDGKIVTAGDRDIFRASIARFGPRGRLDRTFGKDGIVVVKLAPGAEQGFSGLVIQTDGRLVGVGSVGPHELGDEVVPRIVAVRRMPDGSLDPSWGGDGRVVTRFPGGVGADGAVAQVDGRIVAAGRCDVFGEGAFGVVRYLP